jgi:phytoene desaturase
MAARVASRRVVVIGAGLGGLAAACHLAGRGNDVTVIEAAAVPGGRAGIRCESGYRFDTGPTVLTMPHLVEECFDAAGVEMADFLELLPVDPMYRTVFADGTELYVRRGRDAMHEEIRAVCGPTEAASFDQFCAWVSKLYALEMPNFIARNYDSPLDLARPLRPALELARIGAFRRLAPKINNFFADERLRRIFSFQSMYAGLAPYQALALYAVIAYMDTINGVYVPKGGMHALPTALANAAEKAGAQLRYGTSVERILLERGADGPVRGVALAGGEVVPAESVVCNADLPAAYRTLLPTLPTPKRVRTGRYSPSALVWHAGVRGELPPRVAHHNIHFSASWEPAFRALLEHGQRMPEPSVLVTVPTIDEPSMAPPGRHVLYALEPVPNLDGRVDWSRERTRARDELVATVAAAGYPVDTEVEQLVDPDDWRARGLERGTPFSLAHSFFQTGPFRPANVDARAPGLVFVGSATVPGVGLPMVLISGALAAERVERLTRSS